MANEEEVKRIILKLIVDAQEFVKGNDDAGIAAETLAKRVSSVSYTAKDAQGNTEKFSVSLRKAGEEAKGSSNQMNVLSTALTNVARVAAGLFTFQKIIQLFQEAAKQTEEFIQSQFKLEVAIRGLQRAGLDTTIEDWKKEIVSLREQFKIFSTKDITEAVSQVTLMTREFDFSKEQMMDMVRVSILLSEITGKDLLESVRSVTFAVGSGYTEGLQRAGLNISKATLQQRALSMGYDEAWQSIDPTIRAHITYAEVMSNLSAIMDDAGKIATTWAGKLKGAEAAATDAEVALGKVILPVQVAALSSWANFLGFVSKGLLGLAAIASIVAGAFGALFAMLLYNLKTVADALQGKFPESLEDYFTGLATAMADGFRIAGTEIGKALGLAREGLDDLSDEEKAALQDTDETLDALETSYTEFEEKVKDIQTDAQRDREKAQQNHLRRMEDIQRDFERDMVKLEENYWRDLQTMQQRYQFQMAQAQHDYERDVAKINWDAQNAIALENARYQARIEAQEQKHQEALLRLREEYLFDLDDAVRERDARQVLQLNRRYNLEREQLERQREEQRAALELQHQIELQDIERRRQERLAERAAEFAFQKQRMKEELEFQKRMRLLQLRQEQEDRRRRLQEQREDELRSLQQRLQDIATEEEYKLKLLVESFMAQASIAKQGAQRVYDILNRYYGPGGMVERLYQHAVAVARAAIAAMGGSSSSGKKSSAFGTGSQDWYAQRYGGSAAQGFAEGGSVIASKPTLAKFGEAGLEMATFTPLGRSGMDVGKIFGSLPAGMGSRGVGEKAIIEVQLKDGLMGEIVENTLGVAAQVLLVEK